MDVPVAEVADLVVPADVVDSTDLAEMSVPGVRLAAAEAAAEATAVAQVAVVVA